MIARIWKARATPERVQEYAAYLKSTVVPELAGIRGYQGATLLQRDRNGAVDVTVITWWESLDAVRAFAGEPGPHDDMTLILLKVEPMAAAAAAPARAAIAAIG